MTILYADTLIMCKQEAIIINWYYYPICRRKKIPYSNISKIELRKFNPEVRAWYLWGMYNNCWFHLDVNRYKKSKYIVIQKLGIIKAAITPKDCDLVFNILQDKISEVA